MRKHIMSEYEELKAELQRLPEEIYGLQKRLTSVRQGLSQSKRTLEECEAKLTTACDGKNAEQRKAQLIQRKASSGYYQNVLATINEDELRAAELQDDIDFVTRQYSAVCYRARLLAGLMAYLAGAANMPTAGISKAEVSNEDLEAIGL